MSTTMQQEENLKVLSWKEARKILRIMLENYLAISTAAQSQSHIAAKRQRGMLQRWIYYDMDLYLGSFLVSIALLVLTALALAGHREEDDHRSISFTTLRAQLAASILLVAISLMSIWIANRRRLLSLHDCHHYKRRHVASFLRQMDRLEEAEQSPPDHDEATNPQATTATIHGDTSIHTLEDLLKSKGTALTDIYPVYRRNGSCASWTRLPSMLLVQDDLVALQIGDIAPAHSHLLDNPQIQLQRGDRLSLELLQESLSQVLSSLPRGRTTLSSNLADMGKSSHHFLTLCNRMHIFRVEEIPLQEFIHRSPGM